MGQDEKERQKEWQKQVTIDTRKKFSDHEYREFFNPMKILCIITTLVITNVLNTTWMEVTIVVTMLIGHLIDNLHQS